MKNSDEAFMRLALRLARRGFGLTSPNPMVGAVLVKDGAIIGQGWHHRAGKSHAEVEALEDARRHGLSPKNSTLYVTLEPCSTQGRTPPCTESIFASGIKRVVVGATDPNPLHCGRGMEILRATGIQTEAGLLAGEATELNEVFNHWIVHRTPWITVKAAMSMDGKIATFTGQSKWITGEKARAVGMKLRLAADAILVGVNTVIADNPSLTLRIPSALRQGKTLRRIIMDPLGIVPMDSKVLNDECVSLTTLVTTQAAGGEKILALSKLANVIVAPETGGWIDLPWLLKKLGAENVTHILVEGGGETNASFVLPHLAHRIAFFYAPIIIGGRNAPRGISGDGIQTLNDKIKLENIIWRKLGEDMFLSARIAPKSEEKTKDL